MAALSDFYKRAGLDSSPRSLPYAEADLLAGLYQLDRDVSPALKQLGASGLPSRWTALAGDRDPLLDATVICQTLYPCRIVPDAGHAPSQLLDACRKQWTQHNAL
jgi:hypothetical protein